MKWIGRLILVLIISWQISGCFDDVEQPDPQPKSPPPTQELDEDPNGD